MFGYIDGIIDSFSRNKVGTSTVTPGVFLQQHQDILTKKNSYGTRHMMYVQSGNIEMKLPWVRIKEGC